jgi:hypothetical protein
MERVTKAQAQAQIRYEQRSLPIARIARRVALSISLAAAVAAPAARADELSRSANFALGAQLADAITTRAYFKKHCTWEIDPLARPFVHTTAMAIGTAVVSNLILRTVFRHSPRTLRFIGLGETANDVRNGYMIATEPSAPAENLCRHAQY